MNIRAGNPRWPTSRLLSALVLAFSLSTAAIAGESGAPDKGSASALSLKPGQATRAGIQVRPLGEFRQAGELLLPAQVLIDPRSLEVLAAPAAGLVTRVRVQAGEQVKRGQWLGEVRGAPLLALQRDFLAAQAQAETADEALRRDEALFSDGIIPRSRLSQTRLTQRQAAGALAEMQAALRLSGVAAPREGGQGLDGLLSLRAPFDGVVLEVAVQPGQRVEASSLLFKLGPLAALGLEIQASPGVAALLRPGDSVRIDGCARPGRLSLISPSLSGSSQSVTVRATLDQPRGCVQPNQQLQVGVKPARPMGGWVIPREALVRQDGRLWVFLQRDDGFAALPVKLGAEYEQTVHVDGDLPAEGQLVVKGASALKAAWLGLGSGN